MGSIPAGGSEFFFFFFFFFFFLREFSWCTCHRRPDTQATYFINSNLKGFLCVSRLTNWLADSSFSSCLPDLKSLKPAFSDSCYLFPRQEQSFRWREMPLVV